MNSMFFIKKVESDFKKIADFTINEPLEFVYDSDFIFAGVKYINEIDDNFFKKYRDNNICFFRTITIKPNMFILFECLKSNKYTEFSVNEFPTLYLYNKKLNYTFELTYKDLFEEINDIYYFLIAYDLRDTNEWKLGKPFLKKYTFVFSVCMYIFSKRSSLKPVKNVESRLFRRDANPAFFAVFVQRKIDKASMLNDLFQFFRSRAEHV